MSVAAQLHTIAPGETLSGIAAFYGVDLDSLVAHNGINDPNLIFAGDRLYVPDGSGDLQPAPAEPASVEAPVEKQTYTVVEGDTVAKIAAAHGVSALDLTTANSLADPNLIFPGQVLVVPSVLSAPAPDHMPGEQVRAILRDVEVEFDLPAGLLQALAWQESGWQQHVVSHAGAVGVTQVLPVTALWALEYLVDSAPDWETSVRDNARVGASVLRHYLDLTGGDIFMSLAAYYQGWQSIQDYGPFPETEEYVMNVFALWDQFQ
jgi:LysM repeat protein